MPTCCTDHESPRRMTLRIIDIETTGTSPATDKVIEIASVDLTASHDLANIQDTLVNPGIPIPPEASAVHHLIDADVANAPPFEQAIERFKGADFYVAHNASFERGFLEASLGANWICTYKIALRVWPDAPGHNNQTLRYWRGHVQPFNRDRRTIEAHRALSDCFVTAAILSDILQLPDVSWTQLVEWSNQPALLRTISFGMHRGTPYASAPKDYLQWMIDKSDRSEDEKFTAKYWLDRP